MYNPNNLPQPDWRDERSRLRKGNPHVPRVEHDPDRVPDATEARINHAYSIRRIVILILHFVVASLFFWGLVAFASVVWSGDFEPRLAVFGGLVGGIVWGLTMMFLLNGRKS